MCRLTIYTPTLNRAETLKRTYNSLYKQSSTDFKWLIIDDGSTDNTEKIVRQFKTDRFKIKYLKQENMGLSYVMNKAAQIINTEFLLRVDSDDYLYDNAIEIINSNLYKINNYDSYCAIVFLAENIVNPVLYHPFNEDKSCDFYTYRHKYKAIGHRAEVFKTNIFRNFPFPIFEGEKFCLESLIWNRMACKYSALYIDKIVYAYSDEGETITSAGASTYINNPKGTILTISEKLNMGVSFKERMILSFNYFRFAFRSDYSMKYIVQQIHIYNMIIGIGGGIILFLLDSINPSLIAKLKLMFKK